MKIEYTLFLVFAVTAGCIREHPRSSDLQMTDSAKQLSAHKALENVIRDYYRSIERDVGMDLGVSEAEMIEHVQSLINNGYVKEPAILVITKDGPKWKTVDYATYKEFMTDDAIASRKFHRIQPDILDSLAVDSIRSNFLEAFKGDSVH